MKKETPEGQRPPNPIDDALSAKCRCGHTYGSHRMGTEVCGVAACGCLSFCSPSESAEPKRPDVRATGLKQCPAAVVADEVGPVVLRCQLHAGHASLNHEYHVPVEPRRPETIAEARAANDRANKADGERVELRRQMARIEEALFDTGRYDEPRPFREVLAKLNGLIDEVERWRARVMLVDDRARIASSILEGRGDGLLRDVEDVAELIDDHR